VIRLASGSQAETSRKKKSAQPVGQRRMQAMRDQMRKAKLQIKSPARIDRLKQFCCKLPYRRISCVGTRFDADVAAPLDFGPQRECQSNCVPWKCDSTG